MDQPTRECNAISEVVAARAVLARVQSLRTKIANTLKSIDLLELRRVASLSQEQTADLAGVNVRTWSRWERKQSTPSADAIEKVCDWIEKQPR